MIDRWSTAERKEATAFLFFLLALSSIVRATPGESSIDTARRTLPAYAVALNAETTLNSSTCSRQLGVFRDAVDVRKLWALRGIINTILTFRGWTPLSRLSYCAYLLNPFIIRSVYLHSESSMHLDVLPIMTMALGILLSTYLFSYVYSLMMETPYILVFRLFAKSRTQHYFSIDR